MNFLDHVFNIRRDMLRNGLKPEEVRVTFEFLTEKAEFYAMQLACAEAQHAAPFSPELVRCAFDEKPFTVMGISMQIKRFVRPGCRCEICSDLRAHRRPTK